MCQKLRLVKRPFRSRSKQCEFAAQMQKGKVGITWLTERLFHVQPWIVKCTVTRYSKISLFRRPLILLPSSLPPFDIFFSYFQLLSDDHNLQKVSKNFQSVAIELASEARLSLGNYWEKRDLFCSPIDFMQFVWSFFEKKSPDKEARPNPFKCRRIPTWTLNSVQIVEQTLG